MLNKLSLIKMAVASVVSLCSLPLLAEELKLQCKNEDGVDLVLWVMDLNKKTASWGQIQGYKITAANEKYITVRKDEGVGGEYWVIDRFNGAYKRASVGMIGDANGSSFSLKTYVQSGQCTQKKF